MTVRETINTDILIIGAGPAGLATAIHLADLVAEHNRKNSAKINPSIFLIEKGSLLGSHSLSGAVINPAGLQALLPDIKLADMPFETPVKQCETYFFIGQAAIKSPFSPPYMDNKGNYLCALGRLTKWLGGIAEQKGAQIFSGIAGQELLWENGKAVGVRTGDSGVDAQGQQMPNYQPGNDIRAQLIVFAEGPRGHLTKELVNKLGLAKAGNAQAYSLGIKEIWEVPEGQFAVGRAAHMMGWPFALNQFGGGFVYGLSATRVAVGIAVGLDYADPTFDPHNAFQLFKTHPFVRKVLQNGKLVRYGAKTIPEGGIFALPKLFSDNALLAGDAAGFVAMPALKGIHLAIESGMAAAKTALAAIIKNDFSAAQLAPYAEFIKNGPVGRELWPVRNFRQGFKKNLILGMLNFGTLLISGGRGFSPSGRLAMHADKDCCKKLSALGVKTFQNYCKARLVFDRKLTLDKETDVFYSGTKHDEHQPPHLKIPDHDICRDVCIPRYGAPCQYFCPANVYELFDAPDGKKDVRVSFANCVHCKTCDIKDPFANIIWTTPHGGEGPEYGEM